MLLIETKRLQLRNFSTDDLPALVRIIVHPSFQGYRQFRKDFALEDATQFVTDAISYIQPSEQTGLREVWRLAVCLKDTRHALIGYTSIWGWSENGPENPELGYFFDPLYQGRGYAIEASQGLILFFQAHNPAKAIFSMAHPDNIASQKVLNRLGFKRTGVTTLKFRGTEEPRVAFRLDPLIAS